MRLKLFLISASCIVMATFYTISSCNKKDSNATIEVSGIELIPNVFLNNEEIVGIDADIAAEAMQNAGVDMEMSIADTWLDAYNATCISCLAFLEVGSADMGRITEMIPLVCNSYAQMGISRKLNANNDLNEADYLFWKVFKGQNGYYWDKFATYMNVTDAFVYRW